MARSRYKFHHLVFMVIMGALIGSLLGELIALILPEGVVKEFFLRAATPELTPTTLNLAVISLTFGIAFKINVIGLIGIGVAIYIFRWPLR